MLPQVVILTPDDHASNLRASFLEIIESRIRELEPRIMRLTGMADCNTELQARIVDQTKLFDDIADEARPGFRSASEASSYYPKSQQLPQVKRLLEEMKELRDLRTAAPNILGIIESKGLEFDDVAVVGFFSLAAEPFLLAM